MNKIISFVIPAYKPKSETLTRLVKSITVAGLNKDEYEIIIVNDCPEEKEYHDMIQDIIKRFDSYNIVYLENSKNSGIFESRRNGVEHATGSYILFADSDDYFVVNGLSGFNRLPKYDIIQLGFKMLGDEDVYEKEYVNRLSDKNDMPTVINSNVYDQLLLNRDLGDDCVWNYLYGSWAMLLKRDVLLKTYSEIPHIYCSYLEDHLLMRLLALKATSYINCHTHDVYRYDRSNDSTTHYTNKLNLHKIKRLCSEKEVYPILKNYEYFKTNKNHLNELDTYYNYNIPQHIYSLIFGIYGPGVEENSLEEAKRLFISSFGKDTFDKLSLETSKNKE